MKWFIRIHSNFRIKTASLRNCHIEQDLCGYANQAQSNLEEISINGKILEVNFVFIKKGSGYHLDMLIVSITIGINSILGIPWFVAATVLSINHVISLKKESESAAPGEKPKYGTLEEKKQTQWNLIAFNNSFFLKWI